VLLEAHAKTQEDTLWAGVVALEEAANMARVVAGQFPEAVQRRLGEQADRKQQQANELRGIIERLEPFDIG
jgi:hypothetical protein